MTTWHTTCITDKNGAKLWSGQVSAMAVDGEIRALRTHLKNIKEGHRLYATIPVDVESAYIMLDGKPLQTMDEIFDDLEKELGK